MGTHLYNLYCISIHSLRMEGDDAGGIGIVLYPSFQSTPSAWRETNFHAPNRLIENISIHSLRMEGDLPTNHT